MNTPPLTATSSILTSDLDKLTKLGKANRLRTMYDQCANEIQRRFPQQRLSLGMRIDTHDPVTTVTATLYTIITKEK